MNRHWLEPSTRTWCWLPCTSLVTSACLACAWLAHQEHQCLSDNIPKLSSHSNKFTLSIHFIVWPSDGTSPKTQSEGSKRTKGQFLHPCLTVCYCANFSHVLFLNLLNLLKPTCLMCMLLLHSAPVKCLSSTSMCGTQQGGDFCSQELISVYLWQLTVNNTLVLLLTDERFAQLY